MTLSRGGTGRGDLLRAFLAGGEDGLASMAGILGYRETSAQPIAKEPIPKASPASSEAVPAKAKASPLVPTPFWRLEHVEEIEGDRPPPEPPTERPIGFEGVGEMDGTQPEIAPIVSAARLLPPFAPVSCHYFRAAVSTRFD